MGKKREESKVGFKVQCHNCGQNYEQNMTPQEQMLLFSDNRAMNGAPLCPIWCCGACGSKDIEVWRRVK